MIRYTRFFKEQFGLAYGVACPGSENVSKPVPIILTIMFGLLSLTWAATAAATPVDLQDASKPQTTAGGDRKSAAPDYNPFRKSYLSLELARNAPMSVTQNHFGPGPVHPVLGFRHNLDAHWMMGVGGQFKLLSRNREERTPTGSRQLAIWGLYHESLYVLRLDHPTYLMFGPKLLYFVPARTGRLPLSRDPLYQTEIGVALSVAFIHILDDNHLLSLRVDRWRGTGTTRLQGVEVAAGLSFALK